MGRFRFEARDGQGRRRRSRIDADSEADAAEKLRAIGLVPGRIVPAEPLDYDGWGSYHLPSWRLLEDDGARLVYGRSNVVRFLGVVIMVLSGAVWAMVWLLGDSIARTIVSVGVAVAWLVGLFMLLARGRLTVDCTTRRVHEQTRIGPFAFRPVDIDGRQVEAVVLETWRDTGRPPRPDDQDFQAVVGSVKVFTVLLRMKDGCIEKLDESSDRRFQREMAETVARYLDAPFVEDRPPRR